jgi:cysteine desulfurase family protein (TIGR01976 family)
MPSLQEQSSRALDIDWVRAQFPSLSESCGGVPAVFLDGPGGTQTPGCVIEAFTKYLECNNANTGGAFRTSRNTDRVIADARAAMADFLACRAEEIVFGPNMTTLTFAMSRALGRELSAGDEIVVTLLDHGANVSPWQALEERGVVVRFAEIDERDCTLDMDDLARKITPRTKLVAVAYASNAVGSIQDVPQIVALAHGVGAMVYLDAVHYAPHRPIDVGALDCDFLVCSSYKFFGPHMGVLYGKSQHLERLEPYKVRANTNRIPQRWEWGTLSHESIAGITAAVDYLAELGRRAGGEKLGRRRALLSAYQAIREHEADLTSALLPGLASIKGLKLYGISDPRRTSFRCPTFAVTIEGHAPAELAAALGERGIFTWDGNYYALNLTERLGVEDQGGFLRIGLVHYNTREEIDRLLAALDEIKV